MNLHSIRVKSSLPMLILALTLLIVVSMFSYLSGLQKSAQKVLVECCRTLLSVSCLIPCLAWSENSKLVSSI